jgi:monoamine oxidase
VWGKGNGSGYSDTGFQAMWESTRGQAGQSGILIKYTGGSPTSLAHLRHPYANATDTSIQADAAQFLTEVEPVFPGITATWNGRAAGSMAHLNPLWNSSYAYWKVGQCQTIAGYERVSQGAVFFAGEHTSLDFQGFMEGAASEGVRAGKDMIALLRR